MAKVKTQPTDTFQPRPSKGMTQEQNELRWTTALNSVDQMDLFQQVALLAQYQQSKARVLEAAKIINRKTEVWEAALADRINRALEANGTFIQAGSLKTYRNTTKRYKITDKTAFLADVSTTFGKLERLVTNGKGGAVDKYITAFHKEMDRLPNGVVPSASRFTISISD